MYHTYILYSSKLDLYYVGHTENIKIRLEQHRSGESKFTSKANDWVIKYSKQFETRELAREEEFSIKRKKSRKYIEWLIQSSV